MNLTFNKSSWHYKLAMFGSFNDWRDDEHNICAYTRAFIKGCLQSLLIAVGIAIAGYAFWCAVFGIAFSLWYGVSLFNEAGIAGVAIIIFGLLLVAFIMVSQALAERSIRRRNEEYNNPKKPRQKKPDSFIVNAYKAWSQKFCVKLEFVENE